MFNVLQAACKNPVEHYKLDVGLLKQGDFADFIVVEDLKNFRVLETYIEGEMVAKDGKSKVKSERPKLVNKFNCHEKTVADFRFLVDDANMDILVIEALDGQLITNKLSLKPRIINNEMVSDTENDVLKMVVVNRYKDVTISKAFVKNFGLKHGAIASSVAHDSHNIIAVGVDDESICKAVNLIIQAKGGISCIKKVSSSGEDLEETFLPLPVAGLMSNEDGYKVAELYTSIDKAAKDLGSKLSAPFMTLSFKALLVIPHLKLSDLGLFDSDKFELI